MIVKIENPKQNHIKEHLINFSMDVVIYDSSGNELKRSKIFTIANTKNKKNTKDGIRWWRKHLIKELIKKKNQIIDEYNSLNSAIVDAYPNAKSASDALNVLASEVEKGLKENK